MTIATRLAALEKGRIGTAYREIHLAGDAGGRPCAQGHEHCHIAGRYPIEGSVSYVFTRHILGTNIDELG